MPHHLYSLSCSLSMEGSSAPSGEDVRRITLRSTQGTRWASRHCHWPLSRESGWRSINSLTGKREHRIFGANEIKLIPIINYDKFVIHLKRRRGNIPGVLAVDRKSTRLN